MRGFEAVGSDLHLCRHLGEDDAPATLSRPNLHKDTFEKVPHARIAQDEAPGGRPVTVLVNQSAFHDQVARLVKRRLLRQVSKLVQRGQKRLSCDLKCGRFGQPFVALAEIRVIAMPLPFGFVVVVSPGGIRPLLLVR